MSGYCYEEELKNVQGLIKIIEALVYAMEALKVEILYEPATDALKTFHKDTSEDMLSFYHRLKDCEENLKMDMMFQGVCDEPGHTDID